MRRILMAPTRSPIQTHNQRPMGVRTRQLRPAMHWLTPHPTQRQSLLLR